MILPNLESLLLQEACKLRRVHRVLPRRRPGAYKGSERGADGGDVSFDIDVDRDILDQKMTSGGKKRKNASQDSERVRKLLKPVR